MRNLYLFFTCLLLAFELQAECIEPFDEFVKQISVSDRSLTKNIDSEFKVAEVYFNQSEEIVDLKKFEEIPKKYTFEGRIYPNLRQQKDSGLNLKIKPDLVFRPKYRSVLESKGVERIRAVYYFQNMNGCWKLKFKQINSIEKNT